MATTTLKQHVPVFISSTYEDLIPYREEVQRVIVRLEQIVKGMEYFGSSPEKPLDRCLNQVRESKVFIGIIGMRYGSLEESSGLSYSELEYEEAVNANIPILIYIMDENHPIPSKYVDKGTSADRLATFKSRLRKRHMVSTFTSPTDLSNKLSKDLIDTLTALEKIQVDTSASETKTDDFDDTFKRFLLRPKKMAGLSGNLIIKIASSYRGRTVKDQLIQSFGLCVGDTITCEVDVYDSNKKLITSDFDLYADGDRADWLEGIKEGTYLDAEVLLTFSTFKEVSPHDTGRLLRDSSYTGLVLLSGKKIENFK